MKSGSWASFRAAGAFGDSDPEEPWLDEPCAAFSADLWRLGIDHEPCCRPASHDGRCVYLAREES